MKKEAEVTPVNRGTSLMNSSSASWLERDFDSIFDEFRRSFNEIMRPYYPLDMRVPVPSELPIRYAPLDIIDEGDRYKVHVELPGFTKDNVEVNINKDGMAILAKKEASKEDKKKNYLRRERAYSAFERSLAFPEEVDPLKAEGTMKDGVLELTISKKEPKPEEKLHKIVLN